jgi:hypothetical protein
LAINRIVPKKRAKIRIECRIKCPLSNFFQFPCNLFSVVLVVVVRVLFIVFRHTQHGTHKNSSFIIYHSTDMSPEVIGVSLPIIVSLGAFLMIWGNRYLQNKENMAMIERGMEPKSAHERYSNRRVNPSQTLKNGMILLGAGLGLLLATVIITIFEMDEDSAISIYFSLIAIFGGLGMLGAYFYERKNPPTQEQ